MKNSRLFQGAILLGVLALIVGLLYQFNVLGTPLLRATVAITVGAILVVIGLAGLILGRARDRA